MNQECKMAFLLALVQPEVEGLKPSSVTNAFVTHELSEKYIITLIVELAAPTMAEIIEKETQNMSNMLMIELKQKAHAMGIRGYNKMKKQELFNVMACAMGFNIT